MSFCVYGCLKKSPKKSEEGGEEGGMFVLFFWNTFKIKMAHTANTDVHYFMIIVFFYRCKPKIRSTLHFICFFNCQLAFILCFCFLDAAGNSSSAVPSVSLPSFFFQLMFIIASVSLILQKALGILPVYFTVL